MVRALALALVALLSTGCELIESDDDDAGGQSGAGGAGDPGAGGATGDWIITEGHPCPGRISQALHCDDGGRCLVGCGTGAMGAGLFETTDGGDTWAAVQTDPAGFFETARVNDVSRSADGRLYVAGELPNRMGVVALDDAGALTGVFERGDQATTSFSVGTFRRTEAGRAIAESLTGSGIVYRGADSDDASGSWTTAEGFWADQVPQGVQILDMTLRGETFWAAGSTINQPPMVMRGRFEAEMPGSDTPTFDIVVLSEGLGAFTGELWSIEADEMGLIAGGVNQVRDVGVIYTAAFDANIDPVDPAAWQLTEVSNILTDGVWADASTWVEGVCASGGVRYAVGRDARRNDGFVLRSTDGGVTWTDVTAYDANGQSLMPTVDRCVITSDGVYLAGNNGFFARSGPGQ